LNKTVLTFFTVLFLLFTVFLTGLVLNIQTVKASGTIYIRADGSVDPLDAHISSADNVTYIFTDNINNSIVVERDNIVVDGLGYTLLGTGSGIGINLTNRSNVTIRNMEIKAFDIGIRLDNSLNNNISGNKIMTNNWAGIFAIYSLKNSIFGNKITNNGDGVWLKGASRNNIVSGNNITANKCRGIRLSESSNNTLRSNSIADNTRNFYVSGEELLHFLNDVDTSNTVNGKTVYYWINKRDVTVPVDAGYVVLVNCTRITIQNLNLVNNVQGALLAFTTNSTITKNNITNNDYGVRLDYCSNNTISRNTITNNHNGVWLDYCSNNTISRNTITNGICGIMLYCYSIHNSIYHNNFINNTKQAGLHESYNNTWDNSCPSGGNYWGDYNGVDLDHDGIGGTHRIIDANNTDNYPLMGTFSSFNTSLGCDVNVISNSTIENFEFFESNSTIQMYVSNMTTGQASGFCRVCIPKDLLAPNYTVMINDGLTKVLCFNDTVYDNSTHRWIYFAYEHSAHKVEIMPEFTSLMILPLFVIATLFAVIVCRRVKCSDKKASYCRMS
jgi:parallel beta-helix repeat protein